MLCLCVCVSRQGVPACPPDERGHRNLGEAASKRHSYREQLRNLQSQRTQPHAQLRVRHAHTHTPKCAGGTLGI